MQWPLGWLSDRSDRRYVIAGLAAGTSLVSVLILLASAHGAEMLILLTFAAWGGLALCIYSVCVAHACDIVDPGQIVSTIGSLLFSWAAGVTIGPLIGALAMDLIGPKGLFIYSAIVSFALAAFITVRIRQLPRPPAKGGFVDMSPTSSATTALTSRAELSAPDRSPAPPHEPALNPAKDDGASPPSQSSASATAKADTSP
jgi:MFS family permease